jgi:uncharacterized membrane protein YbhN (UPF0104 family)
MLSPELTAPEPTALPALQARVVARRLALPAALVAAAVIGVLLGAGQVHVFADTLRRLEAIKPGWVIAGVAFETISLVGYVLLLSLVAGRATPRIRIRESAQITLAGAAATRLLPTAGAGGAALALWALRRTGLRSIAATRTLLTFLVILYSVFLSAIIVSGALLALGVVHARGPVAMGAIPAAGAVLVIAACLALARARARSRRTAFAAGPSADPTAPLDPAEPLHPGEPAYAARAAGRLTRARAAAGHLADAVLDACRLVRSGDRRLAGAAAYWIFDAAVVWTTLHAFGSAPALPVVALAYFVGQVANTLPIPGSVSGGMAGVLVAFGVHPEVALPAILAYRTIAIWLPLPAAIAAIASLRSSVARWTCEDAAAPAV